MLVCKLHKALYGLKPALHALFERLNFFFVTQLNFVESLTNDCSFLKPTPTGVIFLLVYVDDSAITGSDATEIESVITRIHAEFNPKDLGTQNYFFGMDVEVQDGYLFLSRIRYIQELLRKNGLRDSTSLSTATCGTLPSKSDSLTNDSPMADELVRVHVTQVL